MDNELKVKSKIQASSWHYSNKGVRFVKKQVIEYDTYPDAKINEQLIIIQSKLYSDSHSLYTKIVVNDDLAYKTFFAGEIKHQISNSQMRSGIRNIYTSIDSLTVISDDIIGVLGDFKWMTKQHLTIIFEKGFSGQLTDYKSYALSNFINWANAYYDKIKPVLMKQLQYEKGKENQPIPELTEEQNKEREHKLLLDQLKMLKCILRNPFAYIEKEEESELKEYFKQSLKVFWGRNGYSLEFAFDYLLERGIIEPEKGEIDSYFYSERLLGLEKLKVPTHIENIHKLIGAKNEYMRRLILELIEKGDNIKFSDRF